MSRMETFEFVSCVTYGLKKLSNVNKSDDAVPNVHYHVQFVLKKAKQWLCLSLFV